MTAISTNGIEEKNITSENIKEEQTKGVNLDGKRNGLEGLVRKIPQDFYDSVATLIFVGYFLVIILEGIMYACTFFDRTFLDIDKCFLVVGKCALIYSFLYLIIKIIIYGLKNIFTKYLYNHIWELCFFVLLIWCFISMKKTIWIELAYKGYIGLGGGMQMYFVIAALYVCAKSIKKKENLKIIMWVFVISSGLQSYQIILQRLRGVQDLSGTFNNSNHVAYYLGMAIMVNLGLVMWEKNDKRYFFLNLTLGINMLALILNNTLGVYLAVIAGFVFVVIVSKYSKNTHWSELIFAIIMFLVISLVVNQYTGIIEDNFNVLFGDVSNISDSSENMMEAGSGRYELWTKSIYVTKENPVFGCGTGVSYIYIGNMPHNEFLQLMVEDGIPALIYYILGLSLILVSKLRKKENISEEELLCGSVCFTYLVSSFFGVITYYTFPVYWMFMGILGADNKLK